MNFNYLSSFLVFVFVYCLVLLWTKIWSQSVDWQSKTICMCSLTIIFTCNWIFAIMSAFIISIWTSFYVFASSVCFIRIKNYSNQLKVHQDPCNPTSNASKAHCMIRFVHLHSETLQFLFNMNKLIGNILLMYFICNAPMNSTLIMQLIFKKISNGFKVAIVVFIVQQWTILICIHLLGTFFVSRIKGVHRQLVSVNWRTNRIDLKPKLKVVGFLQNWFTKNEVGMSYGALGVITMMGFAKVSLDTYFKTFVTLVLFQSMYICIRFLMFSYTNAKMKTTMTHK